MILFLEITAVLTGLAYIFLAARLIRTCWIFGGISTLIYTYLFYVSTLYVESGLNAYYVIMAFVGWFSWGNKENSKPVSSLTVSQLALSVVAVVVFTATLAFLISKNTDARFPLADSFIGSMSVVATYLGTRKKIEHWIFWIVANVSAIILFIQNELYLTSLLMGVYAAMAVWGWAAWQKERKEQYA